MIKIVNQKQQALIQKKMKFKKGLFEFDCITSESLKDSEFNGDFEYDMFDDTKRYTYESQQIIRQYKSVIEDYRKIYGSPDNIEFCNSNLSFHLKLCAWLPETTMLGVMVDAYSYGIFKTKRLAQIAIGHNECVWLQLRRGFSFKNLFKKGLIEDLELEYSGIDWKYSPEPMVFKIERSRNGKVVVKNVKYLNIFEFADYYKVMDSIANFE